LDTATFASEQAAHHCSALDFSSSRLLTTAELSRQPLTGAGWALRMAQAIESRRTLIGMETHLELRLDKCKGGWPQCTLSCIWIHNKVKGRGMEWCLSMASGHHLMSFRKRTMDPRNACLTCSCVPCPPPSPGCCGLRRPRCWGGCSGAQRSRGTLLHAHQGSGKQARC